MNIRKVDAHFFKNSSYFQTIVVDHIFIQLKNIFAIKLDVRLQTTEPKNGIFFASFYLHGISGGRILVEDAHCIF